MVRKKKKNKGYAQIDESSISDRIWLNQLNQNQSRVKKIIKVKENE